jgi:hypothetical protein
MVLSAASSLVLCQSTLISKFFLTNRYCLQHSPVPVIVVHPFQRRLHRKQKRETDPDRQSYVALLKLAKQYSSSSDSLVPTPNNPSDTPNPGITIDTPDSLSPDESMQTPREQEIDEPEVTKEENAKLQDSVARPELVDTPLADVEKAFERERENVSPTDKG